MMTLLLSAFLGSLLVGFLVTPVCRDMALRYGLVDRPDSERKTHPHPVPRLGGIPIFAACLVSVALLTRTVATTNLYAAIVVIFAVGLCDDLRALKPWQKFTGQLAAAALACSAGIRIEHLGGASVAAWIAIPLTVVWLVGCTNAINLIDGMDGLATGIALFASLTTLTAALLKGHYALALAIAPLAGALCGFLPYNFNPASIFLGDCGSLPVGFLLGAYGVMWSHKSATVLGFTAPLVALSVPLLDTAVSIVRRFLSGRPIFGADRRHIHHRLLDLGLTTRRTALLLYGVCAFAATVSLLLETYSQSYAGAVLVLFCIAACAGIGCLQYTEFRIAGRLLRPGTFRRAIDAQMRLRSLEDTLASASTVEECWSAVRGVSRSLGFERLTMRLDHTLFQDVPADSSNEQLWSLNIPLSKTEYVKLAHSFRETVPLTAVEPFADVLRRSLVPKLPSFHAGVPADAPVRTIRVRE